jgi:transcription termination/antitermination protein NusG
MKEIEMQAEDKDFELQADVDGGSASDTTADDDLLDDELLDDDLLDEEEETGPRPEWFVIHSYSGMENKVKKNIEHRTESMGMTEKILEIVVPTETEIEIRKGKRKEVERRVFPGYILVNMIMDEDSWYVVRNSPGVTGFVGMGNKPTPLRKEEVDKIMHRIESDEPRIKVSFQVGEHVRILSGPFAEFGGTVDEIFPDKGKAKVLVSFFNRETPVEVDFLQLERDT